MVSDSGLSHLALEPITSRRVIGEVDRMFGGIERSLRRLAVIGVQVPDTGIVGIGIEEFEALP